MIYFLSKQEPFLTELHRSWGSEGQILLHHHLYRDLSSQGWCLLLCLSLPIHLLDPEGISLASWPLVHFYTLWIMCRGQSLMWRVCVCVSDASPEAARSVHASHLLQTAAALQDTWWKRLPSADHHSHARVLQQRPRLPIQYVYHSHTHVCFALLSLWGPFDWYIY